VLVRVDIVGRVDVAARIGGQLEEEEFVRPRVNLDGEIGARQLLGEVVVDAQADNGLQAEDALREALTSSVTCSMLSAIVGSLTRRPRVPWSGPLTFFETSAAFCMVSCSASSDLSSRSSFCRRSAPVSSISLRVLAMRPRTSLEAASTFFKMR